MILRFVTGNTGKVREMQEALGPAGIEVVQDPRGYPEIQADTLQEVAASGLDHLLDTGLEPPFILEDAGLFVDALAGFPGVYSRHAYDTLGCAGILRLMTAVPAGRRTARFEAHIGYAAPDGALRGFTGTCHGTIAEEARGQGGFGFDPVFVPTGHTRTFAQMEVAEKRALSHRGRAVAALAAYLMESANP